MRILLSIAFILTTFSVAHPVSAQRSNDVSGLKAEGDALFDQGRYAEAYDAYKRAYAKAPDAALLYNEARALEAMGEYPEALVTLEQFSADAPADVRSKVPKLDELMADLRSRTSTIHVTTNAPGAHLYVRGKDMGAVDRERTVRARAGEASVRVVADGYEPYNASMNLAGDARVEVDASMKPNRPAASSGGLASGGLASKWWLWTTIGAVIVGGAATAVVLTTEKGPQNGEGFQPGQLRVRSFSF